MQPKSLAQVAVAGGEIAQVPVALPGIFLLMDVSPDGSNLLVSTLDESGSDNSLFSVRTLGGGAARRLGYGEGAAYSPDGNSIVYSNTKGELWLMQSDGTGARKIAFVGHDASFPHWSPDGSVIRFEGDGKLWEISSSGSNFHQYLPGWNVGDDRCCGRWTPDGRFYFYCLRIRLFRGIKFGLSTSAADYSVNHPPSRFN